MVHQVVHFGSPFVVVHGLGVSEMYQPTPSDVHDLPFEVPQCSVLGWLLYWFILYISIDRYFKILWPVSSFLCQWYTQLYLSWETSSAKICQYVNLLLCVRDIDLWMLRKKRTEIEYWEDTSSIFFVLLSCASYLTLTFLLKLLKILGLPSTTLCASICYSYMQVFFLSSLKHFHDSHVSFLSHVQNSISCLCYVKNYLLFKKKKTFSVFLSSYINTSGSLGEREMLWEHEPQASVSTAFSSSPKLLQVFL